MRTKSKNFRNIKIKVEKSTSNIPLSKLFYTTMVLNLITLAGVFAVQSNLPPEIPLFYGLAEGEEQLSSKLGLLTPNLISTVISLLNLLLALLIGSEFLKKSLIVTGFSISALSLLTTLQIIILIGAF